MHKLLESFDRSVWHLAGTRPAVFYLADREGGGILINTPTYSRDLAQALNAIAPLNYAFFPSRFGATDVAAWRKLGVKTMAYGVEAMHIAGGVDSAIDREQRFSRTIDFLPMSGRTESSTALRCKNKPGIVFFGPILECGDSGVPTLVAREDDYSWENRLFGALGLQDLQYEYAFTDDFEPGVSQFGPGIDAMIRRELERIFA